ncbi:C-type lectin domain family 17, member A-like isoform X2 [Palaemon carinicauda]
MLLRLSSFLSALAIVAAQCPDPYVPLDETRCILLDEIVTYTYDEAVSFCQTHGGSLLVIKDCETFGLVYDYIHSEAVTTNHHYWLAASDAEEEGTWKFIDKQPTPMGTPFWGPGQPSNRTGYNCGLLHASYNHKWYDMPCTGKYNAICLRSV